MKEILKKSVANGILGLVFLVISCICLAGDDKIFALLEFGIAMLNFLFVVLIGVGEVYDRQTKILDKLDDLSKKAEY